jgi:hypothetical protein
MGKSGRIHVLVELVNKEILKSIYHLVIFSRIRKGFSIKVRQLALEK